MAHQLACPNLKCGNTIPGKIIGHEVRGVYDGVLVWQCMVCGRAWPRVFGFKFRDDKAFEYAQQLNNGDGGTMTP